MVSKEILANALKQYRLDHEWTLQEMADKTGLHLTTIHRLENGERKPHELTYHILVKRLPGLIDGEQNAGPDCAN